MTAALHGIVIRQLVNSIDACDRSNGALQAEDAESTIGTADGNYGRTEITGPFRRERNTHTVRNIKLRFVRRAERLRIVDVAPTGAHLIDLRGTERVSVGDAQILYACKPVSLIIPPDGQS